MKNKYTRTEELLESIYTAFDCLMGIEHEIAVDYKLSDTFTQTISNLYKMLNAIDTKYNQEKI